MRLPRPLLVALALWPQLRPSAGGGPPSAEPRSVAVQLRPAAVAAAEGCRGHCAPPPLAAGRRARVEALRALREGLEAGGRPCRLNATALRWADLEVLTASPGACEVARLCEALEGTGQVLFCEVEQAMEAQSYTPNDPYFARQYALTQMQLPAAWDLTRGTRNGVVVAIIDTGIDLEHPDLRASLWTNPDEIPGNNVDDDGNGYVDDIHGWDWVEQDGMPQDAHNHGTPAAGIVAAATGNAVGVAGISHGARLMALRFGNSNTGAALAMDYALDKGVRVSCNSWGGAKSTALQRLLDAALNAGHVFVTGAGNGGMDMDDPRNHMVYPCGAVHKNIICTGSTDEHGDFASFNNLGNRSVDVGAPGSAVTTTVQGGGYAQKWGNSIAAPQVAGLVALLLDLEPSADFARVIDAIKSSVDPLLPLRGKVATGGRINALKAVRRFQEGMATPAPVAPALAAPAPTDPALVASAPAGPGAGDGEEDGSSVSLIVGVVAGGVLLCVACGAALFFSRRRRDSGAFMANSMPSTTYGVQC